MTSINQPENCICKICGKPVIDTGGNIVHADGGVYEQQCQNCNWKGGQAGGITKCPSCGDETSLITNHKAE